MFSLIFSGNASFELKENINRGKLIVNALVYKIQ
jgi:hypothetical protein